MKKEHRSVRATVTAPADQPGRFEAVVVRYNVIDSYNTRFRPGVFAESLRERLPKITWGHDWLDLIGQWVDYRDTSTELTLIGQLDEFESVPRAKQAYAQLQSGTIDQFSVGFSRMADELVDPAEVDGVQGVYDIVKADLDECALVLAGAVPGTHLVSVRSPEGDEHAVTLDELRAMLAAHEASVGGGPTAPTTTVIPGDSGPELMVGNRRSSGVVREDLVAVSRMMAAGQLSEAEANTALDLLDGRQMMADPDEQIGALVQALDATLDAAAGCAAGADVTTWPAECQQMWAQVVAAETVVDELGELVGVPDPDDVDTGGDAPTSVSTMGVPTTAGAPPPDTRTVDAAAALALARRR